MKNWIKRKLKNWLLTDGFGDIQIQHKYVQVPTDTARLKSTKIINNKDIDELSNSMRMSKEATLQLVKNEMVNDLILQCVNANLTEFKEEKFENATKLMAEIIVVKNVNNF